MLKKSAHNPWIGVLLSIIYPGIGQIYGERKKKGFLIIFLFLSYDFMTFFIILKEEIIIPPYLLIIPMLIFLFWIYVMVDSYLSVKNFNKKNNLEFKNNKFIGIVVVVLLILLQNFKNSVASSFVDNNIFDAYKISSDTMAPILLKNDRIVARKKLLLKNWVPQRYDIIVFIAPHGKDFIKRIIGLPGETIEIKEGMVLINGTKLNLSPEMGKIIYENIGDYGEKGKSYKIPVDFYYILGDGDKSVDSRFFGFISKSDIMGRAYKIYFPFNRARKL